MQPRHQREKVEDAPQVFGSALRRTWCSRSKFESTSHPHWPSVVTDRRGRFSNSGATSSSAIACSNIERTSIASLPSGGR